MRGGGVISAKDVDDLIRKGPDFFGTDACGDHLTDALFIDETGDGGGDGGAMGVFGGAMGDVEDLRTGGGVGHCVCELAPHVLGTGVGGGWVAVCGDGGMGGVVVVRVGLRVGWSGGSVGGSSCSSVPGQLSEEKKGGRGRKLDDTLLKCDAQQLLRVLTVSMCMDGQIRHDTERFHKCRKDACESPSEGRTKPVRKREQSPDGPAMEEGVEEMCMWCTVGSEPSAEEIGEMPAVGGEGQTGVGEMRREVEGMEVEEGAYGGKGVRVVFR